MNFQNEQLEMIFMELDEGIDKAVNYMKGEFALMRAGRANPKLLEKIVVDYYGTMTPISQMANIAVPEARLLTINLWDKSQIPKVSKAILAANIGVNPQDDGNLIRLVFPALTEERRLDLVKSVRKLCEDTKVSIRNQRRDTLALLKVEKNAKTVSEDVISDCEEEVDKVVSKAIEAVDKLCKEKETEVMSV